ncbi:MAG: hypothetical protein UCO54_03425 [Segatella copri]|nr:hypothetical protein [Segatella copri]
MKLFENRILYSFYCFEVWSNNLADKLFSSLMNKAYELTYKWDPFSLINKEKTTLEEYIAWRKRISKNVVYNLDYGVSVMYAKPIFGILFGAYIMLFVSLVRHLGLVVIPDAYFEICVIICLCLSSLIAYLSAFKDNVYKVYFKKFKKEKNNKKWHFITLCVFLGSLYAAYLSIVLWVK